MLEVMQALVKIDGYSIEDIIKVSQEKANKRGAFDKRIFLEKVITND